MYYINAYAMAQYCLPDYSRDYSRRATDPRRATCDTSSLPQHLQTVIFNHYSSLTLSDISDSS